MSTTTVTIVKAKPIDPYVTWSKLPSVAAGEDPIEAPVNPLWREPIKHPPKEEELRALAREGGELTGGAELNMASLNQLPEDYLVSCYMSLRYGLDPKEGIFPVRAGDMYDTSYLSLTVYPLMAALIAGMYNKVYKSVLPDDQAEATFLFRLQQQVCYAWHEAANVHRMHPEYADRVVCATRTATYTRGDHVEVERNIYINKEKAEPLLAAGWTYQGIADYWVANLKQPQ